jgi:hypothetical protein
VAFQDLFERGGAEDRFAFPRGVEEVGAVGRKTAACCSEPGVTGTAGDAFEEALAGFQRWTGTTKRKLNGGLENDAAELDHASEVTGAGQRHSGVIPLLRRGFG